jgi:hypothetical protein
MAVAEPDATDMPCDIDMAKVCNGQWVQHCELWARNGLPCHDSIFYVCSQLARWLYFVELYHLPKEERLSHIPELLTAYCQTKNNGFISRWDAGQQRAVIGHIKRAIHTAIRHTQDGLTFTRIRQKRATGQYRRVIHLEPYLKGEPVVDQGIPAAQEKNSQFSPSFCCASLCCSSTDHTPEEIRHLNKSWWQDYEAGTTSDGPPVVSPNSEARRNTAEAWHFEPDHTPIPALETIIIAFYERNGWRVYDTTLRKLIALINHLASQGGEGRIGVASLAKMGFPDDTARQHLKRLESAGIIHIFNDYCPAAGRSKRYKLTKMAMEAVTKKTTEKIA